MSLEAINTSAAALGSFKTIVPESPVPCATTSIFLKVLLLYSDLKLFTCFFTSATALSGAQTFSVILFSPSKSATLAETLLSVSASAAYADGATVNADAQRSTDKTPDIVFLNINSLLLNRFLLYRLCHIYPTILYLLLSMISTP